VKRERRIQSELGQVGPTLARLAALANVWPDPTNIHELARALTAAEARGTWLVRDAGWTRRSYERATPFILPRRADRDATRLLKAGRAARRFIFFAERQLERERDERMRSLLATLRPRVAPREEPITRRPDERRDIDPHGQPRVGTQEWREIASRVGARFFDERPRDAM
jgi:hypothetical protein